MSFGPATGARHGSPLVRFFIPALLAAAAPAAALALLAVTGGLASSSLPGLPDAGAVTRWSLPAVTALRDASATLAVGVLVLAAVCVPGAAALSPAQELLRRAAVISASTWTASGAILVILVYSDASGAPVGSRGFWAQAWFFATQFKAGQYLLGSTVLALTVTASCAMLRRTSGLGFAALVSLAAIWPLALGGHASGALDHNRLVDLQLYHLLGVTTWTGGLVGLLLVRRRLGAALPLVVRRYSVIAGWCLALVAGSGIAGALLRLPGWWALESSYGVLLAVKVGVLGGGAALGWWQRARLLRRIDLGDVRAFARLARFEVVFLLVGIGAGVALSRTGPPGPASDPSLGAAQVLLGRDLPPALDAGRWITQWQPDLVWLPVALLMSVAYVGGVLRLRARGERWPLLRTVAWVAGWLLVVWAISGAPGVYGQVLFSMHMVQHMMVATLAPILLVLGAPVTLAMRALSPRTDGSFGPREWLPELLRSFLAIVVTTPVVAAAMFVISLPAFYYTGLFRLALESHTVHQLMVAHFLIIGYVFANCLIGIDPGVTRPSFPLRAVLLLVTFAFHALFWISLMTSDQVLALDWFAALQRPWGASPADDQHLGASLGWALGELPLVVLACALLTQWVSSNRRAQRRFDRAEAHPGDRALNRSNDRLARLAHAGAATPDAQTQGAPGCPQQAQEREPG